ncbi:MAG: hypothetical protein KAT00_01395 [Planctomycetes bacterium]|nr:hypothetical protein [Planctomycetota bacterium]
MTKAIAKQFPISCEKGERRARRLEAGERVVDPLCKILGKTLNKPWDWLYLIPDEMSGYVWIPVLLLIESYVKTVREQGGDVDDPASIPLVIL